MTSPNKPERTALCLILFFAALSITLVNATTESNYKNDTNLLPRLHESTHTENGYEVNIIMNPTATGIYAKESGFNLDLTISTRGIGGSYNENNYQIDLVPEQTFPHTPDLAVTEVVSSKTVVGQGFTMTIEATIINKGFYFETFNIVAHANTSMIQTKTITLPSRSSTTIIFTWNTTDFAKGKYFISAYVTPVPGETDTTDNTQTDGTVTVVHPGDLNNDCVVDISDVVLVTAVYRSKCGDPKFRPNSDVIEDCVIDIADVVAVTARYRETC